jgi:hypothetical protein
MTHPDVPEEDVFQQRCAPFFFFCFFFFKEKFLLETKKTTLKKIELTMSIVFLWGGFLLCFFFFQFFFELQNLSHSVPDID